MAKKKRLPPKMEEVKKNKYNDELQKYKTLCDNLSHNFYQLTQEIEQFRLCIMRFKTDIGNYYDSIKHDSKEIHPDYQVVSEIDKVAEEILKKSDMLGKVNDDYISRKSTSSSNEVCNDSTSI